MKDSVTIHDIHVAAIADANFVKALRSANPVLVNGTVQTLTKIFLETINIEHSGDLKASDEMHNAYWEVAAILFKHLDEVGITAGIGRHAHLVRKFHFSRQATEMVFDHLFLVQQLRVPDAKVKKFWSWCEANKEQSIKALARPGFKLQSCVKRGRAGFKRKGEPWQHMSPSLWVRLGGAALIGVNIASAFPSVGLTVATGIAVASAVAGAAGLVAG